MSKGILVLSIQGGGDNWSPQRWIERFNAVGNGRKVVLLPERIGDPDDVHYAAVWKPPAGALAAFRNLRRLAFASFGFVGDKVAGEELDHALGGAHYGRHIQPDVNRSR